MIGADPDARAGGDFDAVDSFGGPVAAIGWRDFLPLIAFESQQLIGGRHVEPCATAADRTDRGLDQVVDHDGHGCGKAAADGTAESKSGAVENFRCRVARLGHVVQCSAQFRHALVIESRFTQGAPELSDGPIDQRAIAVVRGHRFDNAFEQRFDAFDGNADFGRGGTCGDILGIHLREKRRILTNGGNDGADTRGRNLDPVDGAAYAPLRSDRIRGRGHLAQIARGTDDQKSFFGQNPEIVRARVGEGEIVFHRDGIKHGAIGGQGNFIPLVVERVSAEPGRIPMGGGGIIGDSDKRLSHCGRPRTGCDAQEQHTGVCRGFGLPSRQHAESENCKCCPQMNPSHNRVPFRLLIQT